MERLGPKGNRESAKCCRHARAFGPLYLHTSRAIASVVETLSGDERIVVADLGCGRGNGILSCARELGKRALLGRARCVGVDISARDLSVARELAAKRMPELDAEFLEADLLDGHLGDLLRARKPAVVMSRHVIEHVQGPLENRILQDMLHAAQARVCVSVR